MESILFACSCSRGSRQSRCARQYIHHHHPKTSLFSSLHTAAPLNPKTLKPCLPAAMVRSRSMRRWCLALHRSPICVIVLPQPQPKTTHHQPQSHSHPDTQSHHKPRTHHPRSHPFHHLPQPQSHSKKPSKKRKKASKKTPTPGGPPTDYGTTNNTPTPGGGWRQWRPWWWPRLARQEPGLPVTSQATPSSPTSGDTSTTPLLTAATTNNTPTPGGGWRPWRRQWRRPWWWRPRLARQEPGLPVTSPATPSSPTSGDTPTRLLSSLLPPPTTLQPQVVGGGSGGRGGGLAVRAQSQVSQPRHRALFLLLSSLL